MKHPAVLALLALVAVASCRREDIRTVTIHCPQVTRGLHAGMVTQALGRADGVLPGTIQVDDGRVTVTYDSMRTALKNLEFVIAGAGFDAGGIPADPAARKALPPGSRPGP
jgi:hypothetical protein